jgi:hypothetical protein
MRIPSWVGSGLETRRTVVFTEAARCHIHQIATGNKNAFEFYRDDAQQNVSNVTACIEEVLSIDVRSRYQTVKARRGQFQAERAQRLVDSAASSISANQARPANANIMCASAFADGDCDSTPLCTQQIDNLLVSYYATPPDGELQDDGEITQRASSRGSGAEDRVTVVSVSHLLPDRTAKEVRRSVG